MNQVVHLSFEEIRSAAHDLAAERRKARHDYERHAKNTADAERDYRKKLAIEYTKARSNGEPQDGSMVLARSAAADERHNRDLEQSLTKAALLRIEELEADRAMLRQLGDWSRGLETVG